MVGVVKSFKVLKVIKFIYNEDISLSTGDLQKDTLRWALIYFLMHFSLDFHWFHFLISFMM